MKKYKTLKNLNKNDDIDVSEIMPKCCTLVSMSRILLFIILHTVQKQPVEINHFTLYWLFGVFLIHLNKKWQEMQTSSTKIKKFNFINLF